MSGTTIPNDLKYQYNEKGMMWREAWAKVGAKANWNLSDDRGTGKDWCT
jgi:hypothetical protein